MQEKLFNPTDMDVLQCLTGAKIKTIIFQPTAVVLNTDMLIFNFTNRLQQYSLHVTCFVRIIEGSKLLLTSSDEYFTPDYKCLEDDDENLLTKNIETVKSKLCKSKVTKITLSETADISLLMDNGIKIEIIPDSLGQDYEYYRFFQINKGSHYVVYSHNGQICFELQ